MKRYSMILGLAVAVAVVLSVDARADNLKGVEFTSVFPLEECAGLATSTLDGARNRYFPLEVGRIWELSNEDCVDEGECDELEEVTITVLDETEMVANVMTRVVEERERIDGELDEVSRNFYVECVGTEDVYYFGEDVEDGEGEPLPDGWRAGVDDAMPGIIFPGGAFTLGARYFQEVAPGVALDRAEHMAMGVEVSTPAGDFSECVLVLDTNALEDPKGKEGDEKIYCDGVGIVMDEDLELVDHFDP